jgi:hypothetical protein
MAPHLSYIYENASSIMIKITHQEYDPEAVQIMVDGLYHAAPTIGRGLMREILASPNIDPTRKQALREKFKELGALPRMVCYCGARPRGMPLD